MARQSDRLEDAHHLMVDVYCARQRIGLGLALDHERAQAGMAERGCGERTDWAASDNGNVVCRLGTAHMRKPSVAEAEQLLDAREPRGRRIGDAPRSLRPGGNFQKSGPRGT